MLASTTAGMPGSLTGRSAMNPDEASRDSAVGSGVESAGGGAVQPSAMQSAEQAGDESGVSAELACDPPGELVDDEAMWAV